MAKELRADWRFGRSWSESEIASHLERLRHADINFHAEGNTIPTGPEWRRYYTQAVIARENPGRPEPGGAFEKAWTLITSYQFSDPNIVKAHYDPREPLVGRTMLLELQALGFRFLCGTRVNFDRSVQTDTETLLGFRYDTLEGHIEAGSEWFMLKKNHETGEIRFRIHASWHLGKFPTWWSHLGFVIIGEHYQLAWHRLAYLRLRHFLDPEKAHNLAPVPTGRGLVHAGDHDKDLELWLLRTRGAGIKAGVLGGKSTQKLDQMENKVGGNHEESKRVERSSQRSKKGGTSGRAHRDTKYGGT